MIVIARNTEEKLLEELRYCKEHHPSQRCFLMEFSKTHLPKKELFDAFLRLLHAFPESYRAQVFICHDMDVLIIMQGFMQRQFMDFLEQLAKDLHTDRLQDIADVMEVGFSWARLETFCMKKLEALEEQKRHEKNEQQSAEIKKTTQDILSQLDTELVANLSRRRSARESAIILIVDDDKLSRTLAGNVLMEHYNIAFAHDGRSALSQYVAEAPDVLFLDIGLPDISGHDVLECLFQIDPRAYVIMFSGHTDKENIMQSLETGAQGFLGKPFTREKLFRYVDKSPFILEKQRNGAQPERAVS